MFDTIGSFEITTLNFKLASQIIESTRLYETGGASLMLRPLASEARGRHCRPTSTEWTIEKGLQGQGSCVRLTRSDHRERRDIKAEIVDHLFCHNEATVPTIHHLLWRIANPNHQQPKPIPNHHMKTKPALLPKIHCYNHPFISK